MLTIRRGQLEALASEMRSRFEDRLVMHLRLFFPGPCAALGETGLRKVCGEAVERARGYGLRSERDLCKFLNLVFVFGRDFDRELSWAAEILELRGVPSKRMERLYATALERTGEGKGLAVT